MAYIKYKELTGYFNFSKKVEIEQLPNEISPYFTDDEKILVAYSTGVVSGRDLFVLTSKKIMVVDNKGFLLKKKTVHFFPFSTISSSAIEFKNRQVAILLSMDSGYQVRLNFVNLSNVEQNNIQKMYMTMIESIEKVD